MPRPRKYDLQKLEAYSIYTLRKAAGEDVSALDIQVDLEVEHPEGTASYRLITNWVREFKTRDEGQVLLDSPFQWHLCQSYGIPWEAGPFLLEMCYVMQHIDLQTDGNFEHTTEDGLTVGLIHLPLVREVVWWWRIHLAAPELGKDIGTANHIRSIAGEFVSRELLHEILGRPLEVADLEAWLTWKPWLSKDRDAEYRQAVKRGIIPPVHTEPRERTFLH